MKKWLAILCVIACVFGLTACGSSSVQEGTELEPSIEQYLIQYGQAVFSTMAENADIEKNRSQLEKIVMFRTGLKSWDDAMKSMGEVDAANMLDPRVVQSDEDSYEVLFDIKGTEHDATVSVMFDETADKVNGIGYEPESIAVNVDFSSAELIGQAGLNTILGMGTTFVVLILLAVIISLFGVFHDMQEKRAAAVKAAAPAPAAAAPAAPAAAAPEPETDDGALIAVIAAAIAASEGRTSTDGFIVRSIRRAQRSGWRS